MSKPYGPFTLTAGVMQPVQTDQFPDLAVAVFINESPFTLKVDPGTGSYFIISAFVQDKIILGNQYSGLMKVTPVADINTAGQAPSTTLYVMGYGQGEPIPGTYPAGLTRMTNVGNSVIQAQQILQTGQTAPTAIILASPDQSSAPGFAYWDQEFNDGSFTKGNPALIGPAPRITHDGQGNFGAKSLTAGEKVVLNNTPNDVFFLQVSSNHVQLVDQNTGVVLLDISTAGIIITGPVTLAAGNEETGFCGVDQVAAGAGVTVGAGVNFKTKMTNVPTSITFAVVTHGNDSSHAAGNISLYGFAFTIVSTAAGRFFNYAEYTTVGN